jgi:hypothetical protein
LPILVAAGVVVALAGALQYAVTSAHHGSAPTAQASDVASGNDAAPQTLPVGAPTTTAHTPKPSAHASDKASAHPHTTATTPAGAPETTAPKAKAAAKPKAAATPTAKKTTSAADLRARANAASSASQVLLFNVTTGLCADVPGYGNGTSDGPVNQYDCDGTSGDNQLWDLQVAYKTGGPGGASLFVIVNHKDGLCMDLPNYGAEPAGTQIEEYPCDRTKNDNQLWWLDPRPDGTYWIRDYASGLCIDVPGVGTGREDARLEQYGCSTNTKDDFRWRLK